MSYYTGPSELPLMPIRSLVAGQLPRSMPNCSSSLGRDFLRVLTRQEKPADDCSLSVRNKGGKNNSSNRRSAKSIRFLPTLFGLVRSDHRWTELGMPDEDDLIGIIQTMIDHHERMALKRPQCGLLSSKLLWTAVIVKRRPPERRPSKVHRAME